MSRSDHNNPNPTIRLLVIVNNFPPDYAGGASVFADMCRGLADRGFEVTVRCPYPFYPEWRDKSGRNGWRVWRYLDGALSVERYGLYIPKNPRSLVLRLIHELSFFFSLLRGVPSMRHYDVIMAYCPTVSGVGSAALGKILFRKPLWLNIQDMAAEAALAVGLVRQGLISRILRFVQSWLFNRGDIWSTISPVMAKRIDPLRQKNQPLLVIPNWANASLARELMAVREGSKAGLHNQPVTLLYSGNIGIKQNLLQLLQALADSDADFHFKIHGSGAGASDVEAWIRASKDTRFEFGPLIEEQAFAQLLQEADYFVITETPEGEASFMPSKLVTGIASGTPILAVSHPDSPLGREVTGHDLGPHFLWERIREIPDAILVPSERAEIRYRQWISNSRRRYADYDRDALIDRFSDNLKKLHQGVEIQSDYHGDA